MWWMLLPSEPVKIEGEQPSQHRKESNCLVHSPRTLGFRLPFVKRGSPEVRLPLSERKASG
jgi:hypothetical protein